MEVWSSKRAKELFFVMMIILESSRMKVSMCFGEKSCRTIEMVDCVCPARDLGASSVAYYFTHLALSRSQHQVNVTFFSQFSLSPL